VAAAGLSVSDAAYGLRFENLTVAEPEGFPTVDMGISASDEAVQTMELRAGSTFARNSPDGLLAV
jgi:hypothetical protein